MKVFLVALAVLSLTTSVQASSSSHNHHGVLTDHSSQQNQSEVRTTEPQDTDYSASVYNDLLRYAYLSKVSYCIDKILPDGADLSTPVVLSPAKHTFIQGSSKSPYHSALHKGFPIDLYIAKLLYSDVDTTAAVNKGLEEPTVTQSEGFFGVDHSGNGTVILSIRGTSSTRDLITDIGIGSADYSPVDPEAKKVFDNMDCEGCKVHKGFYKRAKGIKKEVFSALKMLMEVFPDYKLVITGHSMGGAIAKLLGLEMSLMEYHPLVITYGAPKVSNGPLSEFMDTVFATLELCDDVLEGGDLTEGLVRVTHKGDYAPLFPPSTSFHPAGLEFEIQSDSLPHTMEKVVLSGVASDAPHLLSFNVMDVFSFDLKKLLHAKEHSEYFWDISLCNDV